MGARLRGTFTTALLVALSAVAVAQTARADDTDRATKLFGEGRALLDKNDLQAAWTKFDEAARLAPKGAGILINLALCEERLGRRAAAYGHFQRAAAVLDASDDRRPFALDHAQALRPKVALLRITAAGGTSALRVVRDGHPLASDELGQEEAVDPGPHTVDVQASGRPDRRYDVTLNAGEARALAVEPGEAPAPSTAPAAENPAPASAEQPPLEASSSTRSTVMVVAAGAAVAALVPGVIFEVSGFSKRSDLDACKGSCSQDQVDSAKSTMLTGDVLIAVGLAAAGMATYLWVTRPGPAPSSIAVAPVPGGACAAAAWRF